MHNTDLFIFVENKFGNTEFRTEITLDDPLYQADISVDNYYAGPVFHEVAVENYSQLIHSDNSTFATDPDPLGNINKTECDTQVCYHFQLNPNRYISYIYIFF